MLNSRDGPSQANDKVVVQLLSNQRKAVHQFPYIDKSLPLAASVWSDPMSSAVDTTPETSIDTIAIFQKELKDLIASDEVNTPTEKEITWAKQHAHWLFEKHKHAYYNGLMTMQCGIYAVQPSLYAQLRDQTRTTIRIPMKNQIDNSADIRGDHTK